MHSLASWSRTLGRSLLRLPRRTNPGVLVILGYLSYIVLGWLFISLPWSRNGEAGGPLDWLFTSVSAVSTTGLVTVSAGNDLTLLGQIVVIVLVQLGGLGYMTLGSFVILSTSGKLDDWRTAVSRSSLNLPAAVSIPTYLRLIVCYTLAVEAIGAVALWTLARDGPHQIDAWSAVFHSVSAFCTAGFSLYDNSFENFAGDNGVLLAITALSYLGAIGFVVAHDLYLSLAKRKPSLTLTSRIILASTVILSVVATLAIAVEEPLLPELSDGQNWMNAWFQAMSAFTTVGFNSLPIGATSSATAFLLLVCMLIGASPAGTGGGIKTTTVTALWATSISVLRKRSDPTFMGRPIPEAKRRLAVASFFFYASALAVGTYALALAEPLPLGDVAFEAASALGTVGLSRGITGALGDPGKMIIILLMFVGRIGPLALAVSLFAPSGHTPKPPPSEDDMII